MKSGTGVNSVGLGQRIWAATMLVVAILTFWFQKAPASLFIGSGFLLYAWTLFYYPVPGFRSTPAQLYQSARRGQLLPEKYVRLVMLLAVILMGIGFINPFKQ